MTASSQLQTLQALQTSPTWQHSDQVIISKLKVEAVIGVHAWERAITQPLLIDVVMYGDNTKATQSDHIDDAINYQQVCADIETWCVTQQARLIERLAGVIADKLMDNYDLHGVEVQVAKPTAITQADYVAVRTHRFKTNLDSAP